MLEAVVGYESGEDILGRRRFEWWKRGAVAVVQEPFAFSGGSNKKCLSRPNFYDFPSSVDITHGTTKQQNQYYVNHYLHYTTLNPVAQFH